MQKADVGHQPDYGFTIDLQHQAQHAVGRGMLRPHIKDHGAILGALLDARFDQRGNDVVGGIHQR